MKKRRYCCIALILLMLCVSISGCSKAGDDNGKKNVPDIVIDSNYFEVVQTEDNKEHELNVIDDNYRTYYEVFLYSFYDSDGDGVGDMKGLIKRLDYIEEMGFNGIWLMPMMPSPSYHKYDVIDYYTIDPQYGTLEDFKELLAECKKRGIKIIIDLVLNHTSDQHPWFLEAADYLRNLKDGQEPSVEECPSFGYYNFVKGDPANGTFYNISGTDYFYEGVFWSGMPDMNLANEALKGELEKVMKFWLDMGVGGFRLDAAREFYSGSIAKNVEVLGWIVDYVKSLNKDNYIVAEVWDSFDNFTKYYESGIDSIFNFAFADSEGKIVKVLNKVGVNNTAYTYATALVKVQEKIKSYNPNGIDAPFFVNHDLARAAGYVNYDEKKLKMAGALNLMMSGNVFVYYGEELGMSGSGKDENKRAPMYWSGANQIGMSQGPPDMNSVEHKFGALDEQSKNPQSIVNFYKKLIRFRNENPEIARGEVTVMEEVKDVEIAAFTKTWDGSRVGILMNLSETETKKVTVNLSDYSFSGIRNYLSVDGSAATIDGITITMPPYSLVILK